MLNVGDKMKALAGGLTFFNIATVSGVILGLFARPITGRGLDPVVAALSILLGLVAGLAAYFSTYDPKDTAEGIAARA